MERFIKNLQESIVRKIKTIDGKKFLIDNFGISCILQNGNVFEKADGLPEPAVTANEKISMFQKVCRIQSYMDRGTKFGLRIPGARIERLCH
ncbi:hypothetical protein Glove_551g67 [Diversispora epigaea]|uniref:Uncharacterized protein n=1 Tax=Diversispora epigaea TaxID=1348612 RepID=A0A397GBW8_9GLOM|nr:hypothetical protein Glove_551g67 [Diversispora epigaea]